MISILRHGCSSLFTHQYLTGFNRSHLTTSLKSYHNVYWPQTILNRKCSNNLSNCFIIPLKNSSRSLSRNYSTKAIQSSRSKVSFDKKSVGRLLSLAKPERWKLAGEWVAMKWQVSFQVFLFVLVFTLPLCRCRCCAPCFQWCFYVCTIWHWEAYWYDKHTTEELITWRERWNAESTQKLLRYLDHYIHYWRCLQCGKSLSHVCCW